MAILTSSQIGGMSSTPIPAPSNQLTQTAFPTQLNGFTANLNNYAFSSGTPSGTLQFPTDTPKYILTFTIAAYSRTNLNSVGQVTYGDYPSIILPVPQMIDDLSINWAEAEVGTVTGTAINAVAPAAQKVFQGGIGSIGSALSNIGLANSAQIKSGAQATGLSYLQNLDSGLAAGVESIAGISPNQFVVMLMKGPRYKRHKFSWVFSPQNLQEADQLREIARTIKNAASPSPYGAQIGNAPILWQFPHIFFPAIYPNSLFMYKFKPCVCDNVVLNYAPTGKPAFYRDSTNSGPAAGMNAPESFELSLHFIELEYWTEGNFSATNDPADNYGNTYSMALVAPSSSLNYPINDLASGVTINGAGN